MLKRFRKETPDRAALYRAIFKGTRARNLLQTETWREIQTFLIERENAIKEENFYRPLSDDPRIERLALLNAYNAGKRDFIHEIIDEIRLWANQGQEAQVELDKIKKSSEVK